MTDQPNLHEDSTPRHWTEWMCPNVYGVCSNCHSPIIEPNANFCSNCGHPVAKPDVKQYCWTFLAPAMNLVGRKPTLDDTFELVWGEPFASVDQVVEALRDTRYQRGYIISYLYKDMEPEQVQADQIYFWSIGLFDHRDLGPHLLKITNLERTIGPVG